MSTSQKVSSETITADLCCFDSKLRIKRIDELHASLEELEDNLEDHVASIQDNTLQLPPVTFPYPTDGGFLACFKRPKVSDAPSLLGFLEEHDCTGEAVLTIWNDGILSPSPSDNHQQKSLLCEECPVPKSRWTRKADLNYIPQCAYDDQLPNDKPIRLDWIDLTGSSSIAEHLSKPCQVTHFLRSLLGCDHTQSPWTMYSETDDSTVTGANTVYTADADCVVLLLPTVAPEELLEYRVSDASPSWYLHSTVLLHGISLPFQPWLSLEQPQPETHTQNKRSSNYHHLLIYRKLPLRARLSSVHPLTGEPARHGCLWEMVPPPVPAVARTHDETFVETENGIILHDDNNDDDDELEPTYRLVAPPYYDCSVEFPAIMRLIHDVYMRNMILEETRRIPQWTAWPESTHYGKRRQRLARNDDDKNDDDDYTSIPWHVFPLCYSFPADSVAHRKWIGQTCALVPQTVQFLKDVLGDSLRTALFSRLEPHAVLEAHTGWQDLANHVVRIHIPIVIPHQGRSGLCGTWVDGVVETHDHATAVAFDDSKTHRAFNYSSQERIVLIVDVARPPSLPLGTAVGGHSEELDKFIERMGGSGE